MTDTNAESVPSESTWVAVRYREPMDRQGFQTLATVRRTLVALAGHGFIRDVETYSGPETVVWSWMPGSQEPEGIRDGLLDTLAAIAPATWVVDSPAGPGVRSGG